MAPSYFCFYIFFFLAFSLWSLSSERFSKIHSSRINGTAPSFHFIVKPANLRTKIWVGSHLSTHLHQQKGYVLPSIKPAQLHQKKNHEAPTYKGGKKPNQKGLYLLFYIHTELKSRECLLNTSWCQALLGRDRWGYSLFPGLMGTLCQLEHELQQFQGCCNLFCYSRILVGIYYLWKLSDAELYHSSCRPKYLVIICIRVAPGKPRATLCAETQQHKPSCSKGQEENGLGPVACGVWGCSCAE